MTPRHTASRTHLEASVETPHDHTLSITSVLPKETHSARNGLQHAPSRPAVSAPVLWAAPPRLLWLAQLQSRGLTFGWRRWHHQSAPALTAAESRWRCGNSGTCNGTAAGCASCALFGAISCLRFKRPRNGGAADPGSRKTSPSRVQDQVRRYEEFAGRSAMVRGWYGDVAVADAGNWRLPGGARNPKTRRGTHMVVAVVWSLLPDVQSLRCASRRSCRTRRHNLFDAICYPSSS